MKKITFILFALISGTAFAQNESTGTADVKAEIVNPIKITSKGVLHFGTIAASSTESGVITVTAGGDRVIPESFVVPTATSEVSVPEFTVTKEEGLTYSVVASAVSLTMDGGADIPMTVTTSLEGDKVASVDAPTFTVGGTITIGKNQTAGVYDGEVTVTVSYE